MEYKVSSPKKLLYLTETADENANHIKSTVKTTIHKKKRLRTRSKSVSLLTTSRSYRRNYFLNNHFERRGSKDQYGVVDVCLKLTSLNVIAPDLRRAGSFNERIVSLQKQKIIQDNQDSGFDSEAYSESCKTSDTEFFCDNS